MGNVRIVALTTGKQLRIVLHTTAVTAGCGEIPFYMTDSVETTKKTQ